MRRALELASLADSSARPNPMVGAVIVHQGKIIGEGYHRRYGEPHAEVMAVRAVAQPHLLKESTLYVSLEPCSHYGKTPPCANLILETGIPRVVIAMQDPYPEVAGRGIELLRAQGVEVIVGVLKQEAQRLNRAFITQHTRRRPYITLKWAESADGFIDKYREDSSQSPILFSSAYRQRIVHKLRSQHQAILVGFRTALLDNPSLNNRYWGEAQPIRIILDPKLELPHTLRAMQYQQDMPECIVLYDADRAMASLPPVTSHPKLIYQAISYKKGIPQEVCQILSRFSIQTLLIEGGSKTLQAFIDAECYDTIEIERSTKLLHRGVPAPRLLSKV